MANADETRRRKARELRYRKAIVKDVNLDKIWEDLGEIQEACNDVRWYFEIDGDGETLLNALDGNEDEDTACADALSRILRCFIGKRGEHYGTTQKTAKDPDRGRRGDEPRDPFRDAGGL